MRFLSLSGTSQLEHMWCRRYGLVGPNGSGKSTLLKALGNREVPIPEHIDIYFLDREIPASDMTALEAVMSVDQERQRLEKEAEGLIADESEEGQARLEDVYERCSAVGCPGPNPAQPPASAFKPAAPVAGWNVL